MLPLHQNILAFEEPVLKLSSAKQPIGERNSRETTEQVCKTSWGLERIDLPQLGPGLGTVYKFCLSSFRHHGPRHHIFIETLQLLDHKNEQLWVASWLVAKLRGGEVTGSMTVGLKVILASLKLYHISWRLKTWKRLSRHLHSRISIMELFQGCHLHTTVSNINRKLLRLPKPKG